MIAAIVIIIGTILFIKIVSFSSKNNSENSLIGLLNSQTLKKPDGTTGSIIGSNEFTYAQISQSWDKAAIGLFLEVFVRWKGYKINFVLISNREVSSIKGNSDLHGIIVPGFNHPALRAGMVGRYYLFNKEGGLLLKGNTNKRYQEELQPLLNHLILNKYFELSDLFESNRISPFLDMKYFLQDMRKAKNYVLAFFTSICSDCQSGEILRILRTIDGCRPEAVSVNIILNRSNYRLDDIYRLRSNLDIDFNIVLADDKFNTIWNRLINEYSEAELTNIVLIVNSEGMIQLAFYPNCSKCWGQFSKTIGELCHSDT